jgi:hypothetical protein
MHVPCEGICVGLGQYGPFADGKTIPYLDWAAADGSGVFRASVGQGVVPPGAMAQGLASFELSRADNGKLRLRLVAFQGQLDNAAPSEAPPLAEAA